MFDTIPDAPADVDWDALAARVAAHQEATGAWGLLKNRLSGAEPGPTGADGAIRLGGEVAAPDL